MGERYEVGESTVLDCWNVYDTRPRSWRKHMATCDSEAVAKRIARALNLLDEVERQAEAPVNPEDDGA